MVTMYNLLGVTSSGSRLLVCYIPGSKSQVTLRADGAAVDAYGCRWLERCSVHTCQCAAEQYLLQTAGMAGCQHFIDGCSCRHLMAFTASAGC